MVTITLHCPHCGSDALVRVVLQKLAEERHGQEAPRSCWA